MKTTRVALAALTFAGLFGFLTNNAHAELTLITPCRILDTRQPSGAPALADDDTRFVTIRGNCGVPTGATGVTYNATIVQGTGAGFLTLYPGDAPLPLASSLNFQAGAVHGNAAVVGLGETSPGLGAYLKTAPGGGTAHLILDITGYYSAEVACPPNTTRIIANHDMCISPRRTAAQWQVAHMDCQDDGLDVCSLRSLLECDDHEPPAEDCTADTDTATPSDWIWTDGSTLDDAVDAYTGGQAQAYAATGPTVPNEVALFAKSMSYKYFCCGRASLAPVQTSCNRSGGVDAGGACWFLGDAEADCDTTCAEANLDYDDSTRDYAGSGGTDEACEQVLTALGNPGDVTDVLCAVTEEIGCATGDGGNVRCSNPPTNSTGTSFGILRACACSQPL